MTSSSKSTLVVAIRGWTTTGEALLLGKPGGELSARFAETLEEAVPHAEVFRPELEMDFDSTRTPELLAEDIVRQIDARVASMAQLESIVLLGYSSGSVLARRAFCRAHGLGRDGRQQHEREPWAAKIDRVVMLSGITRGWELSASPAYVRFFAPLVLAMVTSQRWLKDLGLSLRRWWSREPSELMVQLIRRGAPFVVEARLQYLEVLRELRDASRRGALELPAQRAALRQGGVPSTVYLLGTKDEFISPADCTELGPRQEFVYLELPGSSHDDAIRITEDDGASRQRLDRLVAALREPYERLERSPWALRSTDVDDYLDPMDLTAGGQERPTTDEAVEHVVMVVHGIRDHGFWTKRVAQELKRLGRRNGVEVRAPTPSYGYLSMWDFVLPGGRDRAVRWFLERYADVKTHFPDARVSFVGHSNGTYLAARALEMSPAVEFEYVVFAGSVVRRTFDWSRFRGRVRKVCNYVGHRDGVVAFLPAVFEGLGLRWLDVGGAGAFGFERPTDPDGGEGEPELHEVRYVRGGHGAAIDESFWPEVARFALDGEAPDRDPYARPAWLQTLFRLAPAVTLPGLAVAAVLLLLPVLVPAYLFADPQAARWPLWTLVGAVVAGLLVSWGTRRFLQQW